eukprot:TRINITY_DN8911_c0_g1_i4.p1 TRINITY_DN8911_c0_g1~~TRINITY_DN8911_c0_g1_i4.p1  ORF type:complete len:177 (-),score=51.72 TRINITY_DN8911_c0_g1_i4:711-1241(-)
MADAAEGKTESSELAVQSSSNTEAEGGNDEGALKALLKRPAPVEDPDPLQEDTATSQPLAKRQRERTYFDELEDMTEAQLKQEAEKFMENHGGLFDSKCKVALRAQGAYELRVIIRNGLIKGETPGKDLMGRIRVAVDMRHLEELRNDRVAAGFPPVHIEVGHLLQRFSSTAARGR